MYGSKNTISVPKTKEIGKVITILLDGYVFFNYIKSLEYKDISGKMIFC